MEKAENATKRKFIRAIERVPRFDGAKNWEIVSTELRDNIMQILTEDIHAHAILT